MSTLGSMSVGSTVKLNVNGTARDFIIVHQGKPSSLYDSSCDGTWLLMKDIYETKAWDSSDNDYKNSDMHAYLNGTFLNLFDSDIKAAIKQAKIPYQNGTGSGGSIASGSSGLLAKIFLLSGYEVGWTSTNTYFPADGACLSYFSGTSATDSKRIANLNGSATYWWLRSPYTYNTRHVWNVCSNGGCDYNYDLSFGVRPALILDSSLSVSSDGGVETNAAPTVPATINVPSNIMGGSTINISWSASTDANGNLEGYIVERSTNGGSTWSQIYQGAATNTTNSVAFGTESVMYRVKAYDSAGSQSGYKTSSQITVVNNTAPPSPASISVPNNVIGGESLTITWATVTDTDGNLSGYKLERSVDGGAWAEIYVGENATYTDSITKGWTSVAYRVKAYDPYTESAYVTSSTRTVDNNTAPTISCDYSSSSDLGIKNADFSVDYSVDDIDAGDEITVTEKLDGVEKRTYKAQRDAINSFEVTGETFMRVTNGTHTIEIEASDGKASTTLSLTMTKQVDSIRVSLAEPIALDDAPSVCAVAVTGYIPADAELSIKVTSNANDGENVVWEDCTDESRNGLNHVFDNKEAENGFAFNLEVFAKRGASGEGGYITSIQGGVQ